MWMKYLLIEQQSAFGILKKTAILDNKANDFVFTDWLLTLAVDGPGWSSKNNGQKES